MKISKKQACTIVLTSKGYPEKYEKGKLIEGIDSVKSGEVCFAGVDEKDAQLVTNGGRVLAVTSLAEKLSEAIHLSNENAKLIAFDGKYYRTDIGQDVL